MNSCQVCGMGGGMHKPNCPVITGALAAPPPNGHAVTPKLIPSDSICPVCGYVPPSVEGANGLPIKESVCVVTDDEGKPTVHCSACWGRFVKEHAPELIKREEANAGIIDISPSEG